MMIKYITVEGVKGGCGSSTITANLAAIYNKQGFKVVVIDASIQNDLSLHFGMPLSETSGLFKSIFNVQKNTPPPLDLKSISQHSAYQSASGIIFFPFGEMLSSEASQLLQSLSQQNPCILSELVNDIVFDHDQKIMVLVNVDPACSDNVYSLFDQIDSKLLVARTDASCYAELLRKNSSYADKNYHLVMNLFSPTHLLEVDMQLLMSQLWLEQGKSVIKTLLKDEFIHEAFAHNTNIIEYLSQSKSSKDFHLMALALTNKLWPDHANT